MDKFRVKKNGRVVGTLEGDDARDLGMIAIERWGCGTYDISMIRERDEDDDGEEE